MTVLRGSGGAGSEGRLKAAPAPARRRPGARDMREVEAEGREFELERFSAEAGWGMPEYMALFWLLGMPDMVWRGVSGGLRGVRGVRGVRGTEGRGCVCSVGGGGVLLGGA